MTEIEGNSNHDINGGDTNGSDEDADGEPDDDYCEMWNEDLAQQRALFLSFENQKLASSRNGSSADSEDKGKRVATAADIESWEDCDDWQDCRNIEVCEKCRKKKLCKRCRERRRSEGKQDSVKKSVNNQAPTSDQENDDQFRDEEYCEKCHHKTRPCKRCRERKRSQGKQDSLKNSVTKTLRPSAFDQYDDDGLGDASMLDTPESSPEAEEDHKPSEPDKFTRVSRKSQTQNEPRARDSQSPVTGSNDTTITICPICDAKLRMDGLDASIHVNACLDGKSIPLPIPIKAIPTGSNATATRSTGFSGSPDAEMADAPEPGRSITKTNQEQGHVDARAHNNQSNSPISNANSQNQDRGREEKRASEDHDLDAARIRKSPKSK